MTSGVAAPRVDEDLAAARRVGIRAPNWLGDAVMALPAMASIRRAFPDSTLTVAAIPSIAPIFEENTIAAADQVVVIPDPRQETAVLRQARLDTIVLFPNSFRTAWASRRAKVANRWGYGTNLRNWLLTRSARRERRRVHHSAYYLELVRRLELGEPADEAPRIEVLPSTLARADRLLEQSGVPAGSLIVAFAPGAAYGHAKRWPPRRVADVVARLSHEDHAACVLVGAESDRDAGREIESALPAAVRTVNLIGRTDLRVLAGVLARSAAFVSNDSGGMHLAAAIGVPVTAIFGPTDEIATAPRGPAGRHDVILEPVFCRPCLLRECPIDHRCMKRISADRVYESVVRHIRTPA